MTVTVTVAMMVISRDGREYIFWKNEIRRLIRFLCVDDCSETETEESVGEALNYLT